MVALIPVHIPNYSYVVTAILLCIFFFMCSPYRAIPSRMNEAQGLVIEKCLGWEVCTAISALGNGHVT